MIVTLTCLTDLYAKPNKQGIQKLIKRNIQYKKQFDTSNILPEQYFNSKGVISTKWCVIKQGEEYFRLAHRFEEIEKLTQPVKMKGFMNGNT